MNRKTRGEKTSKYICKLIMMQEHCCKINIMPIENRMTRLIKFLCIHKTLNNTILKNKNSSRILQLKTWHTKWKPCFKTIAIWGYHISWLRQMEVILAGYLECAKSSKIYLNQKLPLVHLQETNSGKQMRYSANGAKQLINQEGKKVASLPHSLLWKKFQLDSNFKRKK